MPTHVRAGQHAVGEVFYEIYKATNVALGWRWNLWKQWSPEGRVILAGCSGPPLGSLEEAKANLEEFKRLVDWSPICVVKNNLTGELA